MRHWSKTMTIWDRYGSLVKTNSGTTDSQRQFILRSHTQTHTLPLCEIIRLQAEVACVLCGCRCDLVGLCYGLKEPGDTERSQPTERVITGTTFSWPTDACFTCVRVCAPVSSFHFQPVPPSLNSTCVTSTHYPPVSPPPPPPSLCSTERATDPLRGQINSPVRAAQSAEGLGCSTETTSPPTLSHIIHTQRPHIHTTCIHSLNMRCMYKAPEHFFFFPSIFTHPNSTRPPLSEVAADVFCREEAYLGENHDPPFQSMRIVSVRSLPFSLHCAGHYNCLVFTQTR